MDQDNSKDMSTGVKDCGCKEGADGGMCTFCAAGKHSKCTANNCNEPDTDTSSEGDKA